MALAPSSLPTSAASAAHTLPEIITIPEQFYGVALKLKSMTSAERDEAAKIPPPVPKPTAIVRPPEARRLPWAMIGVVAGVIILSLLGFIYFNRDTLFRKPAPAPVAPAPAPIPVAPSGLVALGSQGAVSLTWTDAAGNEQGYHVERKTGSEDGAAFVRITTLPANSTAFIDVTVQPSGVYAYRVIAGGEGGDSAPSNEASATTPAPPVAEAPKPTFPPGGLDTDSDGLTDVEEVLYGTDAKKPDSDNDHFLDGNEVFHLYNPAALAPGKLLESGLVRALTSESGWTMSVPTSWTSGPDETDTSRLLLQTGKGERFLIAVESNPAQQELGPWVAARINQPLDTLGEFTTKGGLRGIYSADRMQAWVGWGNAVFHITYDLQSQPFVNFRTTLEMMLNSLSLKGAAILPTTLTPANSGPGSLLNVTASSTSGSVSSTSLSAASVTSTTSPVPLQPIGPIVPADASNDVITPSSTSLNTATSTPSSP
jgi:hypothetical protein